MGLTIHTELHIARTMPDPAARAFVAAAHLAATRLVQRRQLAGIGPAVPAEEMPMVARWLIIKLDAHTSMGVEIPPLAGWCFAVSPGRGCEPAIFGLCRYPATVTDAGGRVRRTKLARGWSFASACKTQYAALHGWPHFLKCHRAVIDLAQLWIPGGVDVVIEDEGDYWPGRNVGALRAKLATYNGIVAGLAGALKDATEDSGGPPVQSPIFAHPEFEQLEAEGVAKLDEKLRAAREAVVREPKRPRDDAD